MVLNIKLLMKVVNHIYICDFAAKPDKDGNTKYEGLTYELAQRIREHYGKIGDNNFIVNFG